MSENVGVVLLVLGLFLFVVMVIGLLLAPPSTGASDRPPSSKVVPPPLNVVVEAGTLEQDERLPNLAGASEAAEDTKRPGWLRPIGFVSRLLTYGGLFLLLYTFAPKDISNTPLGTLTLSDILATALFIGVGIVLVRALFNPSESEQIKDAWGWLGIVLAIIVGIGTLYLYNLR